MRTRSIALASLVLALGPLTIAGVAAPAGALIQETVTTDGWTWEVLSDENELLGAVTPPALSAVGGLDVETTAPTLRAPSIPLLRSFMGDVRWTYDAVVVDQPIADGPVTIAATLNGPGGTFDVTAEIDGGSVEYTLSAMNDLTDLVAVEVDPVGDDFVSGGVDGDASGTSVTNLRGWYSGSSTHHSAAWALDQLDSDPNNAWVVFVEQAGAPVDVTEALTATASASQLLRMFIFADGPSLGLSTPADTWIARVSLSGGIGCATEAADLVDRADGLVAGIVPGGLAAATGCVTADPASGAVGVPFDEVIPLTLDPALSAASWWADQDELEVIVGDLPDGVTVALEVVGGEPQLRIGGTPAGAGSFTVPFVIGGSSTAPGTDLIDAVSGSLVITVAPALAATGSSSDLTLIVVVGVLTLGLGAVALARVRAPRRAA